jgi:hypothetical protein
MPRRLPLFALYAALVLTACARPHCVRRFGPRTKADSVVLRNDSLMWAEALRTGSSCLLGNPLPRVPPPGTPHNH